MKPRFTKLAQKQLDDIFDEIELKWGMKAKQNFIKKVDACLLAIELVPSGFQLINKKGDLRLCCIGPQTSILYRSNKKDVVIIAMLNNRSDIRRYL